jgi:predicted secreted protein
MAAQDGTTGEIKHLSVQAGQPFPIQLWEDRTRGEQWVPSYDTAQIALVSDDYLRVAGNNAVDNGTRTFEFRALEKGEHRIVFEKRMGWKFTAEDRRVFLINATDGASR